LFTVWELVGTRWYITYGNPDLESGSRNTMTVQLVVETYTRTES
jgi:hypothetical protein